MNKNPNYLRETIAIVLVAVACRGELLAANSTTLSVTMVPSVSITGDTGKYTLQYASVVGGGQTNWVTLTTNLMLSGASTNWLDYSGVGQAQRFYRTVEVTNGVSTNSTPVGMVRIPEGSFLMGNCMDTNEGDADELPVHTVYVSAFYMDMNLVTKKLWDEVYHWATNHDYSFDNAGLGKAATHPVQTVSWYDTVKWCNARSEKEGRVPAYYTSAGLTSVYRTGQINVTNGWVKWNAGYRLPTEAEWEKAARGGLAGKRFPWGNIIAESLANYVGSSATYRYDSGPDGYNSIGIIGGPPYTSPVGSFLPNGYGLYDMSGNVWEWCWDRYGNYDSGFQSDPQGASTGSDRVIRGGLWDDDAWCCRVACHDNGVPDFRGLDVGFRSVLPQSQP